MLPPMAGIIPPCTGMLPPAELELVIVIGCMLAMAGMAAGAWPAPAICKLPGPDMFVMLGGRLIGGAAMPGAGAIPGYAWLGCWYML